MEVGGITREVKNMGETLKDIFQYRRGDMYIKVEFVELTHKFTYDYSRTAGIKRPSEYAVLYLDVLAGKTTDEDRISIGIEADTDKEAIETAYKFINEVVPYTVLDDIEFEWEPFTWIHPYDLEGYPEDALDLIRR